MKNIIIADDSITSRMIIRRCLDMLGLSGVTYHEAKDGVEALAMATGMEGGRGPDLLIADLNMPNMDGETLVTRLKAAKVTSDMPVVIASSATNSARSVKLSEMGVLATIGKPVSPAALQKALAPVLERFQGKE